MAESRAVNFLTVFIIAISLANSAAGFSFLDFCGRTTRRDVCVNTINQDPRGNLKNDPSGMCVILGDKAKSLAASTYQKIKDALGGGGDPGLQNCLDGFDELIAILRPLNFSSLNGGNFQFLNVSLLKALQAASECLGFAGDVQDVTDVTKATKDVLNLNQCNNVLC